MNLAKRVKSFFCEILYWRKLLGIVIYMILCAALYLSFADRELLSELIHDFSLNLISPNLIFQISLIGAALAVLLILIFVLGTCMLNKSKIKKNIPNVKLPRREYIPDPILILFIPHRRKGYIEMEFHSPGADVNRWEELQAQVEYELDIKIIKLYNKKNQTIVIHAITSSIHPKAGTLYDD